MRFSPTTRCRGWRPTPTATASLSSTSTTSSGGWKARTTPPGESFDYDYDDAGNLESRLEGGGLWEFTWDTQNRLTQKSKTGVPDQDLVYDKAGNLTSYNDGVGGGAVTYTYDERNQVDHITIPGLPGVVDADYDDHQRREFTRYPNGVTEQTFYNDKTGTLDRIDAKNAAGTVLVSHSYSYLDPDNGAEQALRRSVTDLAGNVTRYGYINNRVTSAVTKNPSDVQIASYTYGYDKIGNMTQSTVNGTATYRAYDPAAQLCYSGTNAAQTTCPPPGGSPTTATATRPPTAHRP